MKPKSRRPALLPAFVVAAITAAALALVPAHAQDNAQMERGKQIYLASCSSCHLADGRGMPEVGVPPVANADFLRLDRARAIRICLKGNVGPITVNLRQYNGMMPSLRALLSLPALSPEAMDDRIADVLSYVMNSWGNHSGAVTAEEVAAIRKRDASALSLPDRTASGPPPADMPPPAPTSPLARSLFVSNCAYCHDDGKDSANLIPPLAGSDFLRGDPAGTIGILLTGLSGPIVVNGRPYDDVMPVQVFTDRQIMELVNYVLNTWGNSYGTVTEAQVATVRTRN